MFKFKCKMCVQNMFKSTFNFTNTIYMCKVVFLPEKCFVHDLQSEKMIGKGCRKGNLYYINYLDMSNNFVILQKKICISGTTCAHKFEKDTLYSL